MSNENAKKTVEIKDLSAKKDVQGGRRKGHKTSNKRATKR